MTATPVAPTTLPPGYTLRPPAPDDFDAVFALVTACAIAESGEPYFPIEDLRADWQAPDRDLESNAWMVLAADGTLAAYADVTHAEHARMNAYVGVLPQHIGHGLATYLVRHAEARARELGALAGLEARVSLRSWVATTNTAARHAMERQGFAPIRTFWRMRLRLGDEPPAAPTWPDGISVRTLVPGTDDQAVYAAFAEAFADHWGDAVPPYDEWRHAMMQRESFDPSLWFLAQDNGSGGDVVGFAICRPYVGMGWVDELGVRRPWRKRGLGMALLRQVLGGFYRRGERTVGLGVDADSPTGASWLYQRAGMHAYQTWDIYEKELRPGVESDGQRDR